MLVGTLDGTARLSILKWILIPRNLRANGTRFLGMLIIIHGVISSAQWTTINPSSFLKIWRSKEPTRRKLGSESQNQGMTGKELSDQNGSEMAHQQSTMDLTDTSIWYSTPITITGLLYMAAILTSCSFTGTMQHFFQGSHSLSTPTWELRRTNLLRSTMTTDLTG